jgi:hypothetical protein
MYAKYIFVVLALLFLVLASRGMLQAGTGSTQARTWLVVSLIFGAVGAWLFTRR